MKLKSRWKPRTMLTISAEPKKRKAVIILNPTTEVKIVTKKRNEVVKHQENIRQILLYSNATPIRRRGGIGYKCCFCTEEFPDPADLKRHTIDAHDDEAKSTFTEGQIMQTFLVKLDITQLRCKLCESSIDSVEEIMQHLTTTHGKKFHLDIKSHIIPFKFDSEKLKCISCAKECNTFKVLLEHMNVHFRNHVCDICDSGFVNIGKLQTHGYRHKTGVFNCSRCNKVFDNRLKQKDHERAVHVHMNKRNKCGYCNEMFGDYTTKHNHEVNVHGVKRTVLNCNACDKSFDNQRSLTVHTKNYHLLERRMLKSLAR